jgi:hypothetical protein
MTLAHDPVEELGVGVRRCLQSLRACPARAADAVIVESLPTKTRAGAGQKSGARTRDWTQSVPSICGGSPHTKHSSRRRTALRKTRLLTA